MVVELNVEIGRIAEVAMDRTTGGTKIRCVIAPGHPGFQEVFMTENRGVIITQSTCPWEIVGIGPRR